MAQTQSHSSSYKDGDGGIVNADIDPAAAINISKLSGVAASGHIHDDRYYTIATADNNSLYFFEQLGITNSNLSAHTADTDVHFTAGEKSAFIAQIGDIETLLAAL